MSPFFTVFFLQESFPYFSLSKMARINLECPVSLLATIQTKDFIWKVVLLSSLRVLEEKYTVYVGEVCNVFSKCENVPIVQSAWIFSVVCLIHTCGFASPKTCHSCWKPVPPPPPLFIEFAKQVYAATPGARIGVDSPFCSRWDGDDSPSNWAKRVQPVRQHGVRSR